MSYDNVVLPGLAPMAPLGGAVPPPPPPLPVAAPSLPTLGADSLNTSAVASTYFPQQPPAYGYQPYPYAGPDVFDTMRDVTHGVANGLDRVGTQVGQALPVIGEHVWDGTQVVGRTVVEGGKQAAGFLPGIGRGLWGAVSWVGDKLADAGRAVWGGADRLHDRLKSEYGPLPYGPVPGYNPGWGMPWPPAVIVERGDTLRSIAQQFLGDGERWRELYALNEPAIKAVGGLRTGMVLAMPSPYGTVPAPAPTPVKPTPKPAPVEPKPTPKPVGSHTVKKGETLWGLAHRYYGDATRWREIYEANHSKIEDPRLIYPGQVLKIPR